MQGNDPTFRDAPVAEPAWTAPPQAPVTERVPEQTYETISETYPGRRDRLRWGPVMGGLVVAVGTYLILQLGLLTSGLVDLSESGTEAGLWSAGAAIVSFLLGGITAGASASWSEASDGVLHGIVMWSFALVAIVVLASVGSGLALGSLDTTGVFDDFTNNVGTQQTTDTTREAAGWALIGLTAALIASAIGGAIGAKMWPRHTTIVRTVDRTV